ncbi:MAG: hypothetical protein IPJ32_11735 [Sphingobacteriaceae bacterium]|nr:hypothetical protein [Sphingobacteriaceae bacterium]
MTGDDEMGKAIKGRILNWEGATIANLKGKNAEDYYEIAKADKSRVNKIIRTQNLQILSKMH